MSISNDVDVPEGTRLAHLIETDGPGGAEQVLAALVNELGRRGCRNTVFLPADREGWLARQLEGSETEVIPFRLERPLSARFTLWLAGTLKKTGSSLAHSHEFTMAFYGACAARIAGIPHVITMHGSRYYAGHPRRTVAMRLAAALSEQTVAVSQPLRRGLMDDLALSGHRVGVILNGASAPTPDRVTLREELGLDAQDTLVVSVANLYPVKGHTHLLRAMALLDASAPRLHLALAGRGQLEADLAHQARALGIADRVHFLGLRADVPNVLHSADLFVLPSLSEGLPLSLLEAMLAGVPVIATRVGEVPVVLPGEDFGLTVPPGDARALGSAIDRVLADPREARAMAGRGRARADSFFSVGNMVDSYAALYGPLLRERR